MAKHANQCNKAHMKCPTCSKHFTPQQFKVHACDKAAPVLHALPRPATAKLKGTPTTHAAKPAVTRQNLHYEDYDDYDDSFGLFDLEDMVVNKPRSSKGRR